MQIRLYKALPLTTLFDSPFSSCKRLPRSFFPDAFLPDAALFSALTWFAKPLVSWEFIPKVGGEPVEGGEGEGKDGGYWERWRDGRDGIYIGGVSFVVGVGQHYDQDQR